MRSNLNLKNNNSHKFKPHLTLQPIYLQDRKERRKRKRNLLAMLKYLKNGQILKANYRLLTKAEMKSRPN